MIKKPLTTRDLCYIGVFAAIIATMAQISIPMPYGVPMTLQTFAVMLAGIVLGTKRGAVSAGVYVLLGMLGVPVFSAFRGGIGIVLGPTGGFILSFPLLALAAGIGAAQKNKLLTAAWLFAGVLVNYICGMLMFSAITSSELHRAFSVCVLPFIPVDIVKTVLAGVIGLKVRTLLERGGRAFSN